MHEDPLDALIDDTARGMTEGTPSVSLRAAVRDRVAQPRRGWAMPAWGIGAAAAAVVVIAAWAVVIRPGVTRPVSDPVQRAVTRPPVSAPLAAADDRHAPLPVPEMTETPLARTEPPRVARVQATAPPADAQVIARPIDVPAGVVVIEPVAIEPLWPQPVQVEIMETPMPLCAEWVEIEPLRITEE